MVALPSTFYFPVMKQNTTTQKVFLRATMRWRRQLIAQGMDLSQVARKTEKIFFAKHTSFADRILAGYVPLPGEVPVLHLLRSWHRRGGECVLPQVVYRDRHMNFAQWVPGHPLIRNKIFNFFEPPDTTPPILPDILFVPMLCCDILGTRLGFGGGFYDRTLSFLRTKKPEVFAIGVVWQDMIVPYLPREKHDQHVDAVLTEETYYQLS